MTELPLTGKRLEILDFIDRTQRERGYPPSVREICEAVGLTSTSTVHAHLATLQKQGFLRRDPTKPRAIEVRYDPASGTAFERRPVRHVPLVGDVAAGTDVLAQENIEELYPLPEDFTGAGPAVHAAGARRLDDRRRHPRRRPRRRPPAARGRARVTSSSPASPARRRRSRPTAARAARWCSPRPTRASSPMEFDADRGDDLRQGGHRPPPDVTPSAGPAAASDARRAPAALTTAGAARPRPGRARGPAVAVGPQPRQPARPDGASGAAAPTGARGRRTRVVGGSVTDGGGGPAASGGHPHPPGPGGGAGRVVVVVGRPAVVNVGGTGATIAAAACHRPGAPGRRTRPGRRSPRAGRWPGPG